MKHVLSTEQEDGLMELDVLRLLTANNASPTEKNVSFLIGTMFIQYPNGEVP